MRRAVTRVAEADRLARLEVAARAEIERAQTELARGEQSLALDRADVTRLSGIGLPRLRSFVRGTYDEDLRVEQGEVEWAEEHQAERRDRLEDAQVAWSATWQTLSRHADAHDELAAALEAVEDLLISVADWRADQLLRIGSDLETARRRISTLDALPPRIEEVGRTVASLARAVGYCLGLGRLTFAGAQRLDAERAVAASRLAVLDRVLEAAGVAEGWSVNELARVRPLTSADAGVPLRAAYALQDGIVAQQRTLAQVAQLVPAERRHRQDEIAALTAQRLEVLTRS